MKNKNISSLLVMLTLCSIGYTPAFAQDQSDRSTFTKHYVAQNDQSESEEDSSASEESGQSEESDQQAGSSGESGEPAADLSSFMPGGGGGGRVSLATLFVQAVGMGILVVFLVAIPISFTCVCCALIWQIGMLARGGKKPDIG